VCNHFHNRYLSRRRALLLQRARELRARETESERRLWRCLVSSKLGVAFRRQYVIGGRVADFAAPSVRLVVEVDGSSHAGRERADARRDRQLARLGYRVLRLDAALVLRDPPLAVARVVEAMAELRVPACR
jgi:very-short-patch-repair endonuclease